jgi:hypothetical protein
MSIISGNTIINGGSQNNRYISSNNTTKRGNSDRQDQSPSPHQYFRGTAVTTG